MSIAGGPARDQNFEDEMEEVEQFQLPGYLTNQVALEAVLVEEMDEGEKEGQIPKSPKPDIKDKEMAELERSRSKALEALDALKGGNPGKRKAPEGGKGKESEVKGMGKGYFKIRKALGEQDKNVDEDLRLSMDNKMEFTKFENETIQVNLAVPDKGPWLSDAEYGILKADFALTFSNEYNFDCMRVPRRTGFYKAINWRQKNFPMAPFKKNHPNPLSVMGGFMGAGDDAKFYFKRGGGFLTLKYRANQTVNLIDVGSWRSVYSMIKMVQNFTFEDYFLTSQGYFFRQHMLYPGTRDQYYHDQDIPHELRQSLGWLIDEYRIYFKNKSLYNHSMRGDLREMYKEQGVSNVSQFCVVLKEHFRNNGLEPSEVRIIQNGLMESWRVLQYACYRAIWGAFMGEKLEDKYDPSFPADTADSKNPRFQPENINEFEQFVENNKSSSTLFTDRRSFCDVDFTVSYVLEHLLENHEGGSVDGWIYVSTPTLIDNIPAHLLKDPRRDWDEDSKHKFVNRINNKLSGRHDFHSEINVFNESRGKFYYEGASEDNPYVVGYKDMKFTSKFEGMCLSELSYK